MDQFDCISRLLDHYIICKNIRNIVMNYVKWFYIYENKKDIFNKPTINMNWVGEYSSGYIKYIDFCLSINNNYGYFINYDIKNECFEIINNKEDIDININLLHMMNYKGIKIDTFEFINDYYIYLTYDDIINLNNWSMWNMNNYSYIGVDSYDKKEKCKLSLEQIFETEEISKRIKLMQNGKYSGKCITHEKYYYFLFIDKWDEFIQEVKYITSIATENNISIFSF